jgi:ABC-type antimicrobial peptide transport system permease subunit
MAGLDVANYHMDTGAFDTLGMTLLAGRGFLAEEIAAKQPVIVLSERAAHLLWPGEPVGSAVGRTWRDDDGTTRRVVGVVKNAKTNYGSETAFEQVRVFTPLDAAVGRTFEQVVVRTDGPAPSVEAMRARLEPVFGPVVVHDFDVSAAASKSVLDPRFRAGLFFVMGATGVVLLIAGLYATAGAEVAERRFEMGLRLALGASSASVARGVVSRIAVPIAVGTIIGLIGAFWIARTVDSYLYRVDSRDPWSYALVFAGMLVVAAAAAWPAARRAARTDPARVLRQA